VGKGTLIQELFARRSDCTFSVSATTRPARPGEVEGQHYFFLSHETFERWAAEGRFLEYNEVHGQLYGTPREAVDRARDQGRHVLLDIDVKGGLDVMQRDPSAVSVFIAPPDMDTLRRRLVGRGTETPEQVARRLTVARKEIEYIPFYEYTIVNDLLGQAVERLNCIIEAESCLTKRLLEAGFSIP
jgi:guanylate kinase